MIGDQESAAVIGDLTADTLAPGTVMSGDRQAAYHLALVNAQDGALYASDAPKGPQTYADLPDSAFDPRGPWTRSEDGSTFTCHNLRATDVVWSDAGEQRRGSALVPPGGTIDLQYSADIVTEGCVVIDAQSVDAMSGAPLIPRAFDPAVDNLFR